MDLGSVFFSSQVSEIEKIFFAMIVSLGFAVLFNSPKRSFSAVLSLALIGYGMKEFSLFFTNHIVISTFVGACCVGMLGVLFAHWVHTPPIVFTIPAIINMIPGRLGCEFMMAILELITKDEEISFSYFFNEILLKGIKTGAILWALGIGVVSPILFFQTTSVKNRNLMKMIKSKLKK